MGRLLDGASGVEAGGGVGAGSAITSGAGAGFGTGIGAGVGAISGAGGGSGTGIGAAATSGAVAGSGTGISAGAVVISGAVAGFGTGTGAGGRATLLVTPLGGARGALRALGARARGCPSAVSIRYTSFDGPSPAVSEGLRLAPGLLVGTAAGMLALLAMAAVGALLEAVGTFAGLGSFFIMAASEVSPSSVS